MAAKILYVFPDTNLFIQCHPLEALDWGALTDCQEVHLIVCRAVQAEIDLQKGLREGRKQRKARAAASILRKAIKNGHEIIRKASLKRTGFLGDLISWEDGVYGTSKSVCSHVGTPTDLETRHRLGSTLRQRYRSENCP